MFEFLATYVDPIFSPLTSLPSIISLFLLASVVTVITLFINNFFMRRDFVRELKTRMEEIREEMIEFQKRGEIEKVNKLMNELTKINVEYIKHSVKAVAVSMLIVIFVLPWVQVKYQASPVGRFPAAVPYLGDELSWMVWYFIASLTVGWVVRKLMGWEYG